MEQRFDVISGGHIQDQPQHLVPDGFWNLARNVRFIDNKIQPRPGYLQVFSSALPDALNHLKPFISTSVSAGTHTLIGGTKRDLAKWLGTKYTTGDATHAAGVITFVGADLIAAGIHPGDCLRIDQGTLGFTKWYVIKAVTKTTECVLTESVTETVSINSTYEIMKGWRFITPRISGLGVIDVDFINGSANVEANPSANVFGSVSAGDFIIAWADDGAGNYYRKWYEVSAVSTTGVNPNDRIVLTENYEGPSFTTVNGGDADGTGDYEIRNCFTAPNSNRWQSTMMTSPPNPPSAGTQVGRMVFCNLSDNTQKWDGSAYATEDLSTGLKARYCCVVANHLILAHMGADPFVLRWSNFADPDDFSFDPASTAGGGPVADDPYGITGIHAVQERLFVLQRDALSVFVPTGTLPAFIRQELLKDYGNELPYGSYASKNSVVFYDRDGLFLWDGGSVPRDMAEGKIWNTLSGDFNWANREYAFAHYSPKDKEFYLFYNSKGQTVAFANKAVCISTTPVRLPSGESVYPISIWESAPTASDPTPPFVHCMGDWEETLSTTIDTLPDDFDWYPQEDIDSMPWSSIDSIGLGPQYMTTWVGTSDGKAHRWGGNYDDNSNPYLKTLMTKWYPLGDPIDRKMVRYFKLYASPTGTNNAIRLRVYSKFDLVEIGSLRKEANINLLGNTILRVNMRVPGKWYRFMLESQASEFWEIYGFGVDAVPVGKREASWYDSIAAAYGGSVASGSSPSSSVGRASPPLGRLP